MPSYRVAYEIDVEAETPLEAAHLADFYMQRENRAYDPVFYVTDLKVGLTYTIDTDAEGHPE